MELSELKVKYAIKSEAYDIACAEGKSQAELAEIYKELKEIQYQMIQVQIDKKNKEDD